MTLIKVWSSKLKKKDEKKNQRMERITNDVLSKDQTKLILNFSHECTNYSRRVNIMSWESVHQWLEESIFTCDSHLFWLVYKVCSWNYSKLADFPYECIYIQGELDHSVRKQIHCFSEQMKNTRQVTITFVIVFQSDDAFGLFYMKNLNKKSIYGY